MLIGYSIPDRLAYCHPAPALRLWLRILSFSCAAKLLETDCIEGTMGIWAWSGAVRGPSGSASAHFPFDWLGQSMVK